MERAVLVGNAQSLIGKNKGCWIDEHKFVIRMNGGAPTNQNGQQVGTKTTHWSFSTESEKQYWKWRNGLPAHLIEMRLNPRIKYPSCGGSAITNDPDSYFILLSLYGEGRPSTGVLTAYYLTCVMNWRIDLIGFDFFQTKSWYRQRDNHGPHPPARELQLIRSLPNCNLVQA
jgi:hypothetical protein